MESISLCIVSWQKLWKAIITGLKVPHRAFSPYFKYINGYMPRAGGVSACGK